MFQNINEDLKDERKKARTGINVILKNIFSLRDIVLYIISFMVSMVSFGEGINPFALAIFASTCSNRIPSIVVFLVSGLGTFIKFGLNGFLFYFITSLIFIVSILIFKPIVDGEQRNEKQRLGLYLICSLTIVQALKLIFMKFLLFDLLTSIMLIAVTYIFYKIFSNSIIVIKKYNQVKAFSIEEAMGASLLISIAISALNGISIYGLSVTNILSIALVLFMGWTNGMLVGATSGITIGVVLAIINMNEPSIIAAFAVSGLIAGILNKLGKIGVAVGFIVGNTILSYITNGNTIPIITIREILIASITLIFIPKKVKLNIEDVIGNTKCFPVTCSNKLGEDNNKTIYKLNSMSDTISEMVKEFDEVATTRIEEKENKEFNIFKEDFLNNIEEYQDNLLYEDIIDEDENIVFEIFELLEKQEIIEKDDLIKIFEKHKHYLIQDEEENDNRIQEEIKQVVRLINETYRINKLNYMWELKINENRKTMSSQLNGVSKAISELADNLDDNFNEKKTNKFSINIASAKIKKDKSTISGDSYTQMKLDDGKCLLAISDGMGSRRKCKKK